MAAPASRKRQREGCDDSGQCPDDCCRVVAAEVGSIHSWKLKAVSIDIDMYKKLVSALECASGSEVTKMILRVFIERAKDLRLAGFSSLTGLDEKLLSGTRQLRRINLSGCTSLTSLAQAISSLNGLEKLNLSGCRALKALPASIGELKNLNTLTLQHCITLENVPDSVKHLRNLRTLDLEGCKGLVALPKKFNDDLENLFLDDCCAIESLPATIGDMEKLQDLSLAGCTSFKSLPSTFENLAKTNCAIHFYLSNLCSPSSIVTDQATLSRLENLRLVIWVHDKASGFCEKAQKLKMAYSKTDGLQTLSLSLAWRAMPTPDLGELRLHVDELILTDSVSRISGFAFEKKKVEKVFVLRFQGKEKILRDCQCMLEVLPMWSSCIYSDAYRCPPAFPEGFTSQLCIISVKARRAWVLPKRIFKLPHVKHMDLEGFGGKALPSLERWSCGQLQDLDLSNSHLSSLPEAIRHLSYLRELNLSGCTDVLRGEWTIIVQLCNLRSFNLSGTRISTVPRAACINLTNLEYLVLDKCPFLRKLDFEIGQMTTLKRLSLNQCSNLEYLPKTLVWIDKLELSVEGCIFHDIPEAVISSGGKDVLGYLKGCLDDLQKGAVPCYMVKVILVGEQRAGKSSVLESLTSGEPKTRDPSDRTVGVDIWRWRIEGEWHDYEDEYDEEENEYEKDGESESPSGEADNEIPMVDPAAEDSPSKSSLKQDRDKTLLVNLYDSAGQRIYRASHGLVMSEQALYLNVVSSEGNEADILQRLLLWVEVVQQYVPGARMAVVFTHLDRCETWKLVNVMERVTRCVKDEMCRLDELLRTGDESAESKIRQALQVHLPEEIHSWTQARDDRDEALEDQDKWTLSGCQYQEDDPGEYHDEAADKKFTRCPDCDSEKPKPKTAKSWQRSSHWRLARCPTCAKAASGELEVQVQGNHTIMMQIEEKLRQALVAKTSSDGTATQPGDEEQDVLCALDEVQRLRRERLLRPAFLFCVGVSCKPEDGTGLDDLKYEIEVVLRARQLFPLVGKMLPGVYQMIENLMRDGQARGAQEERERGEACESELTVKAFCRKRQQDETAFAPFVQACQQPYVDVDLLQQRASAIGIETGPGSELDRALDFLHHSGSVLRGSQLKGPGAASGQTPAAAIKNKVFCQPQWIIDAIKYVIREPNGEDVNDEIRELDAQIRNEDGGWELDRFLETGLLTNSLLTKLWSKPRAPRSKCAGAEQQRKFSTQDIVVLRELLKQFGLLKDAAEAGSFVVPAMLPSQHLPEAYTNPLWMPVGARQADCWMRRIYRTNNRLVPFGLLSRLQVEWARREHIEENCADETAVTDIVLENKAGSVLKETQMDDNGVKITETVVISVCRSSGHEAARSRDEFRVMAWVHADGDCSTTWPLFRRVCDRIEEESVRAAGLHLRPLVPYVDAGGVFHGEEIPLVHCQGQRGVRVSRPTRQTVSSEELFPHPRKIRKKKEETAITQFTQTYVLAFAAREEADLNLERELGEMERIFDPPFHEHFQMIARHQVWYTDLFASLSKHARDRFVVVHLAGHGDGGFKWLDPSSHSYKESTECELEMLSVCIGSHQADKGVGIQCAVLNACSMEEMGKKLVDRGIPWVVCWKTKVKDQNALAFSKAFYARLAENVVPASERYADAFESAVTTLCNGPAHSPGLASSTSATLATASLSSPLRGRDKKGAENSSTVETVNCVVLFYRDGANGPIRKREVEIKSSTLADQAREQQQKVLSLFGLAPMIDEAGAALWGSDGRVVAEANKELQSTLLQSTRGEKIGQAVRCLKVAEDCLERDRMRLKTSACDCVLVGAGKCSGCDMADKRADRIARIAQCRRELEGLALKLKMGTNSGSD